MNPFLRRVALAIVSAVVAGRTFAGSEVTAAKAALSTASPQATQVGLSVMQRGGNAIDAAVAVALALAVTHPQAGNIGGGGFLIYYDAATRGVWTLDFRETAPLAAKRDMFGHGADATSGKSSRTGALAAAVPGTLAGLQAMHQRFGSQPWSELVLPAIRLAREGYITGGDLTAALSAASSERHIEKFPSTSAIFYPSERPLAAGSRFVQNDLAATLERISAYGAADFYNGELADRTVRAVRTAGGSLSYRDLKEYKAVWRAAIRIDFRNYSIYAMAPPSAGGLIVGEALNILGGLDLEEAGFQSPLAIHLQAEAERRAFIDRNQYLGDPASIRIPYAEILSAERARLWRASINPSRVTPTIALAAPGSAPGERNQTTHFSIVDPAGNMVAFTYTLDDDFGSGFVVPGAGFLLNDAMDDFTMTDGKANREGLVQGGANAIAPGRRPASSMSPLIILRDGKPFMALGATGGPAIATTLLQVFLNLAVHRQSLAAAIAAPRYHQQGLPEEIFYERRRSPRAAIDALIAMGHAVKEQETIGDVHAVMIDGARITAVADPRHGGSAGGF